MSSDSIILIAVVSLTRKPNKDSTEMFLVHIQLLAAAIIEDIFDRMV